MSESVTRSPIELFWTAKNIDSCLTFGSATKSDKSKDGEEEEGREFEDETEDTPPAADGSVNGDEAEDETQG